jgi:hypothetical protein
MIADLRQRAVTIEQASSSIELSIFGFSPPTSKPEMK